MNTSNECVKRAERGTAGIVAEYPFPATINDLHTLLALAYLHGAMDELRQVAGDVETTKERVLHALEGGDAA